MAQQWFYEKDGRQHGPLSSQQIQSLGQSGEIDPEDLVWREGMKTKIPAAKYKGLLPGAVAADSSTDDTDSGGIDTGLISTRRSNRSNRLKLGRIFELGMQVQFLIYRNWPAMVFLWVVFLFACGIAASLIVSIPLIPIFCMGYAINVERVRERSGIRLESFIAFLQRGWSSLFNVFELFATLILVSSVFYFINLNN